MSTAIEREILWTGIGGQGVQLAAKVLALAATREGREVMSLGTYGGTMRGGNTDATVVVADGPIQSAPMVSRAWAAIVVHPRFFEPVAPKLRAGGLVVVDEDLLEGTLPACAGARLPLAATRIAREAEAPKAAALVLLGAFAQATGLVGLDALEAGLEESLPSYRRQTLESNRRALQAGAAAVPGVSHPAWRKEAA
ncbi:MAG: 2-oxoacid:acceptor oxidoreductase family protein [Myxococcales bacterium]|nr:2-oxoacid:acceptor oxidoreductase family protein [Myxococcales bacterium]